MFLSFQSRVQLDNSRVLLEDDAGAYLKAGFVMDTTTAETEVTQTVVTRNSVVGV